MHARSVLWTDCFEGSLNDAFGSSSINREVANLDDVIASLYPVTHQAREAIRLGHNRTRCRFQISHEEEIGIQRKRQYATPESDDQLYLTFSEKPFDPLKGFVFGSDEDTCDILLSEGQGRDGISRRHFSIHFQWETRGLLLTDLSSTGTTVSSCFAGLVILEKKQIPILSGDHVQAGLARFRIAIPSENGRRAQYFESIEQFHRDCQNAVPHLNGLAVGPRDPKTFLDERKLGLLEELGRGLCGTVFKALDNRGRFYAVKIFNVSKARHAKNQDPEQVILQEISNTTRLKHKHIISVIEDRFLDTPQPTLVMEFMSLGSLEQHRDFCRDNVLLMLRQLLQALSYIHDHNLAHRDIKSANILVSSRDPLLIKLSDFGFTGEDPLTTYCGSLQYAAPEIVKEEVQYTKMVDIYAVGILIFEYFHHCCTKELPPLPNSFNCYAWRWRILTSSSTIFQPVWRTTIALAKEMLDLIPQNRPTASSCLQRLDPNKEAGGPDLGIPMGTKNAEVAPTVTRLAIDSERAVWTNIIFNKIKILILDTILTGVSLSRYIVKARNIYQALNMQWNGHSAQSLPRVIVEKASKDQNGTYVSLNHGLSLCRRFGGTDLAQKICEFAEDNGALNEITCVKSFSQLKRQFDTIVQLGEFGDLPLAINLTMLFRANGLTKGQIKSHLPLIRQGPYHIVKGSSVYPPPGPYTTIEHAVEILKLRGVEETSKKLQKYLDQDLWSSRRPTPEAALHDVEVAPSSHLAADSRSIENYFAMFLQELGQDTNERLAGQ